MPSFEEITEGTELQLGGFRTPATQKGVVITHLEVFNGILNALEEYWGLEGVSVESTDVKLRGGTAPSDQILFARLNVLRKTSAGVHLCFTVAGGGFVLTGSATLYVSPRALLAAATRPSRKPLPAGAVVGSTVQAFPIPTF
jgi:hypothetical protein